MQNSAIKIRVNYIVPTSYWRLLPFPYSRGKLTNKITMRKNPDPDSCILQNLISQLWGYGFFPIMGKNPYPHSWKMWEKVFSSHFIKVWNALFKTFWFREKNQKKIKAYLVSVHVPYSPSKSKNGILYFLSQQQSNNEDDAIECSYIQREGAWFKDT